MKMDLGMWSSETARKWRAVHTVGGSCWNGGEGLPGDLSPGSHGQLGMGLTGWL
jgi:hypothetical protein